MYVHIRIRSFCLMDLFVRRIAGSCKPQTPILHVGFRFRAKPSSLRITCQMLCSSSGECKRPRFARLSFADFVRETNVGTFWLKAYRNKNHRRRIVRVGGLGRASESADHKHLQDPY